MSAGPTGSSPSPIPAVLLIGPTGSGKTPQGILLERNGYGVHFDFGHELRRVAQEGGIPEADRRLVCELLRTHALLPDDRFDIAEAVLDAFLRRVGLDKARHRLILNGLPRHAAQARDLEACVDVKRVIVLECDRDTVALRVGRRRRGEGLDHAGRDDDHDRAIEEKLRLYEAQTTPLIRFYEARPGTQTIRVRVEAADSDESVHRRIVERLGRGED